MHSVPEAMADDARREPVEAVDEVDRVRERDHPQGRDEREDPRAEHERPANGILSCYIVAPVKYRTHAARTSPATFAGRDISRRSSTTPDDEDHRRRRARRPRSRGDDEDDAAQRRDRDGHHDRDAQPHEHRGPAAVGRDAPCMDRSLVGAQT